ncbi:GNAT family N-acetyltransferase [Flavobacterium muglaense]|uniref:GNAT family N-acetyltransferase n=1 Tax=Flavobacterium muglaense TaxID=2764716 RepID=A0A923N3G2_9FLAO|nr:GNAT family N-acetyltransferase [Flavobacterium muglaense]MBC5839387.1 GNAT family N-acetyltransferase [Flavobacterium muglaense]MBC5845899.1 GNAT family N-acetyltransferase [Flavobacterium muglaense]
MYIPHKLDNPVWYSLAESHEKLAITYNKTHFYNPEYCAFGAFNAVANDPQDLVLYAKTVPSFFIFGAKPILPESLYVKDELLCYQMIVKQPIVISYVDEITKLNQSHRPELLVLVKIVYPEYFKSKTADLGNYYGIFKDHQLVAITGERMQMDDFIEVSAVITHPDHTGEGYAKQLVAHTANAILKQNKTPFLHVATANNSAIKLYEKLGFNTRTTISNWQIAEK